MEIVFKENIEPYYSPIKNKEILEKQTNLKLFGNINKILEYKFKDTDRKRKRKNGFACYGIFRTPQIDYNGKILGCCVTNLNFFSNNAFKQGLKDALNSPDYIYAKHMLTDFSIKPIKKIKCSNCNRYKVLKESNYPLIV